MIYLLFFLIPIVLLLAWGVMVDQKRRRRGNLGHDVNEVFSATVIPAFAA